MLKLLSREMVELEDQRIGLAAVDAGTLAEELDEIGGALGDDRLLATQGLGDIALPVRGIVLAFVGGSARAAVVVPLAAGLAAPGEVREREGLLAAAAGTGCVGGADGVMLSCAYTNICSRNGRTRHGLGLSVESTESRGVAQSGSAPGWGPGGRRFKSCLPDKQTARVHGPFVCLGDGRHLPRGPIWGPMLSRHATCAVGALLLARRLRRKPLTLTAVSAASSEDGIRVQMLRRNLASCMASLRSQLAGRIEATPPGPYAKPWEWRANRHPPLRSARRSRPCWSVERLRRSTTSLPPCS